MEYSKYVEHSYEALSSFAKTDRVNFNEIESASIYYGIMASAVKHNLGLDSFRLVAPMAVLTNLQIGTEHKM